MQYYHNCTISLVNTVSDFSPGVDTVWTHRDHTVATPGPHRSDAGKHRIESGCGPGGVKNFKTTGTHRDVLGCETTPAYSGASP